MSADGVRKNWRKSFIVAEVGDAKLLANWTLEILSLSHYVANNPRGFKM